MATTLKPFVILNEPIAMTRISNTIHLRLIYIHQFLQRRKYLIDTHALSLHGILQKRICSSRIINFTAHNIPATCSIEREYSNVPDTLKQIPILVTTCILERLRLLIAQVQGQPYVSSAL
jgi:hypothetical protein